MEEQLKYQDLTRRIIKCAMAVHRELGNGFQEIFYQKALDIEFELEGLKFNREFDMYIFYRNQKIGTRRVDFYVEELIMVELKAVIKLEEAHLAQGLNYLEASNNEIGLLINFGSKSLEFKRLYNKKYKSL